LTRIYDISMPVRTGGLVYPGNPEIRIELQQAISKGAGANVSSIYFGSHTATHVDAPRHFSDAGAPVDSLSLNDLIGPALLLRFEDSLKAITRADLERRNLGSHKRVLFATRNSRLQTESAEFVPDYTYVAPDAAEYLVELGVRLVGVDYLSVEQFHSGHHRTHHALLDNAVVIIEGLQLSDIPEGEYKLVCLPLKIVGCDAAPARAILIDRNAE
jgi:arylformamidase